MPTSQVFHKPNNEEHYKFLITRASFNRKTPHNYQPITPHLQKNHNRKMSTPVSAVHGSTEIKATPKTVGRSSDFHPSIWGDHFLKYTNTEYPAIDVNMEQNVGKMKEEVKRMFDVSAPNPSETLQLIDAIQRLGFAYHFENEITEKLREINKITLEEFNDDLHIISLWFRLLRQEGYNVSSGIFHKFTNKEGKFDNTLVNNVEGMLSLYEAAHLMANGEPILEEALAFTTTHLKSSTASSQLSPFLAAQVKHALKQPIRKGLPRVEARHFISIYEENPSHSEVLLNFAKLDFNILQKLHQKELNAITRLIFLACYDLLLLEFLILVCDGPLSINLDILSKYRQG